MIGAGELIEVIASPSFRWLTRLWEIPVGNEWLGQNAGLFISVLEWLSAVVCLGLLVAFTSLRSGWSVVGYLALKRVSWKSLAGWLLAAAVFSLLSEWAVYQVRHYLVADWSIMICRTTRHPALLWSALLIAAPLSEELLCRGFMFRGLQASALGAMGLIVVPAIIWAGLQCSTTGIGSSLSSLAASCWAPPDCGAAPRCLPGDAFVLEPRRIP